MACFTLGLIISLLRYRLYDAEAAISRSAGYAVLTLLLGLAFAVVVKAVEYLVETWLGQEAGGLSGAIAAGLAVLMVTPLKDRVQAWAERRFQKDLLTLRRDLPACVEDLRDTGDSPRWSARCSTGCRPACAPPASARPDRGAAWRRADHQAPAARLAQAGRA